jgi:hypothetical protein
VEKKLLTLKLKEINNRIKEGIFQVDQTMPGGMGENFKSYLEEIVFDLDQLGTEAEKEPVMVGVPNESQ